MMPIQAMASGVDWGNVPAWLGATFTPASVYVAYRALQRNNRNEERRQAAQVHVTYDSEMPGPNQIEYTVTVDNRSDAPISEIQVEGLVSHPDLSLHRQWGNLNRREMTAQPKATWDDTVTVALNGGGPYRITMAAIFRDANGLSWARISNGQLIRASIEPRWKRSLLRKAREHARKRRLTRKSREPYRNWNLWD